MTLLSFEASSPVLSKRRASQQFAPTDTPCIPRRVVQFWDTSPPLQISRLIARNRELCQTYSVEHVLFDEQQARNYIAQHAGARDLQAFDAAIHPAMKCDVFRLCYLGHSGGYYLDADIVLKSNLDELVSLPGELVIFQWDKDKLSNLCNWLIGSKAGQAQLLFSLQATSESVIAACAKDPSKALKNILNISGPGIFTRAIASSLASITKPDGRSLVNIQTVSRAHQLIQLGPAYLAAPLDYKMQADDDRHWKSAAAKKERAAAAGIEANETAAPGITKKFKTWLTSGEKNFTQPLEGSESRPAVADAPNELTIAKNSPPRIFQLKNQGLRNIIDISENSAGQLNVNILGNDNIIRIESGVKLQNLKIDIRSSRCEITIGRSCVLAGEFYCRDDETRLFVGPKTTMMGSKITMHETGTIRIGEDCMLAGDVRMDTSDMHSIIDVKSGHRINPPGDICIGDHVWLGFGAYVLKGVSIGSHCVIGAHAVISQDLPANSLAVGIPARVVRTGVTWDRRRLPMSPVKRP